MTYNLYQENLAEKMDSEAPRTFRNANIDLNKYYYFLQNIATKLKKLSLISIQLQQIEKEEGTTKISTYFQYEITDKNNRIEEIEKLLFDTEIKYLFLTGKREKGEKRQDNQVEIQNRNSEEKRLYFKEDFGESTTLYIRQDEYQINMQMKAIERLRDRPLQEHLPLLKLFENGNYQKLSETEFDYKNILNNESDWNILKPQKKNEKLRDGTKEQREFVKKALATSDFALLEGPPGSGKTTTIIELIIELCKQGKRILLCSSTHVAVDNVLKRILTTYKKDCQDWVAPIRIARDKGQIRYKEVEEYRLQELVFTKAGEIKQHLQGIPKRNESQEKLLESLKTSTYPKFFEEAILEASNLVCGTMIGILQHPKIKSSTIDIPFDVMIVDEASKVTFQEFLVPALYAKKWILVGDVQQLSPYVEGEYVEIALSQLLKEEQKKHLQTVFPIWKAAQYKPKKPKDNRLKILLSNDFDKEEIRKVFDEKITFFDLDTDFKNPLNDALTLNAVDIVLAKNTTRNRDILEKYIYVKAQIFEGFLNGEFQRVQCYYKNNNFNHSKKERSTWESELAHRLSQHYAFRSLPELGRHLKRDINFLTSYNVIVNEKYNTTLEDEVENIKRITMPSILELLQNGIEKPQNYKHLNRILYDGFPRETKYLKFQSLTFQHRMNDLIAQTSRNNFYKKNLQTANTVKERNNPLESYKKTEEDVIWQTNNAEPTYSKNKKRQLNANKVEAGHIIKEVKDFLEWAESAKPKKENEPFEIAVLCFYRDQEVLMRQKLRQLFWRETERGYAPAKNFDFKKIKVTLCTVDRFQGDEADMVLLSFTKASPNAFYKSPNRLNVALTRARYKLVLFGNHGFFKNRVISEALTELAQFDVRKSSASKHSNSSKNHSSNRHKNSKK